MTKITVDETLRSKLKSFSIPLEFCDETGVTVGHFLPNDVYKKLLYGSFEIPFSEEEIERRQNETGGRSLADIWKCLGRT